jgi:hypothetical protein
MKGFQWVHVHVVGWIAVPHQRVCGPMEWREDKKSQTSTQHTMCRSPPNYIKKLRCTG